MWEDIHFVVQFGFCDAVMPTKVSSVCGGETVQHWFALCHSLQFSMLHTSSGNICSIQQTIGLFFSAVYFRPMNVALCTGLVKFIVLKQMLVAGQLAIFLSSSYEWLFLCLILTWHNSFPHYSYYSNSIALITLTKPLAMQAGIIQYLSQARINWESCGSSDARLL